MTGYQVGRIYGRTCQLSKPFHFLGIPGRVFFKFDMGKVLKRILLWMVGFEPTTPKNHGLSMTPFVKKLVGY